MAGFTDSALEKKLADLNSSQQSIQTLSLWLIHHRKHHKPIVHVWFRELRKAKANRKLTFIYLANDVIQNSRKKGPEFNKEFGNVMSKAFAHVYHAVTDEKTKNGLERVINVWQERNIYDRAKIQEFREALNERKKKSTAESKPPEKVKEKVSERRKSSSASKSGEKSQVDSDHSKKRKVQVKEEAEAKASRSPPGEPPDSETMIKALLDLENSPSTDAEVREKIASLPPEVSDISLLDKIHNRESAKKLSKQVNEACDLLADYNTRLSEELENRKTVSKMLADFIHYEKECLASSVEKLEEYESKLKRVDQVKTELKSHLQNLPDLTLLPSVTGGLAPLPSAGDLFN